MIDDKELEILAGECKISFNCQECKRYWGVTLRYWNKIGQAIEGIHLHCPSCSPYRPTRGW